MTDSTMATNQNTGQAPGPAATDIEVREILVIGSGAMGRQIGMVAAVAGFTTAVRDVAAEAVAAAEQDMRSWLEGRVAKGRMDQADRLRNSEPPERPRGRPAPGPGRL